MHRVVDDQNGWGDEASNTDKSQEYLEMTAPRDKAVHLFTYLRELSKLHTTHSKDIAKYDELLWFSDVPTEPGCYCASWELWNEREGEREKRSDSWVEVHKPSLMSHPEVPDDLESWIRIDDLAASELGEPGLKNEIEVVVGDPDPDTGEETTEIRSIDDPRVEMWMEYVEKKWKPWAEEDRRLRRIQKVYNSLYTIYQRSEKLGEQYEVIVGLGFLLWRSPKSGEIRHPLLALRARVSFDQAQGIMSVSPALDGPQPRLEIDMLEDEDRPSIQGQQAIQEMLNQLDGEPWNGSALEAVLRSLANGISTGSRYDRSMTRPTQISDVAQLHCAPVLILRKRTRRTFVDFHNRIVEQLEGGCEIAEGVRSLVEIVADPRSIVEKDPNEHSSRVRMSDTELYFPLPTNDEQKQIAQRIEQGRGILVQGPPGTGKSHAITNLVAHFLAKGLRILVTSETPRALEVLKRMLPEEIRELCVIWLGSGLEAQKSLEQSVQGITQKKVNWDLERDTIRITELEGHLDQTRRNQAKLWSEYTACRYAEIYEHTDVCGGYSGTLAKIAVRINKERERFAWFLDRPRSDEELGLTVEELLELLQVDRQLADNPKQEIGMRQVPENCLIPPAKFAELVVCERRAIKLHEATEKMRMYPNYEPMQSIGTEMRARMLSLLKNLISSMDELAKHIYVWVDRAAREIAAGQDHVWRHLLETTEECLRELSDRSREFSTMQVIGLEGRNYSDVDVHARDLKAHLGSGKGLGLVGMFRPRVVKEAWYLIKTVRVEGELCRSVAVLKKLLDWLSYERRLDELADRWGMYTSPPKGDYAVRIAAYKDLCEPLREAVALGNSVQELKELVSQLDGVASPHWHMHNEVVSLCDAVEAVDIDEGLTKAREGFAPLERQMAETMEHGDTHPSVQRTLDAIHERNTVAYEQAYEDVSSMRDLMRRYEHTRCVLKRIKVAAPKTIAAYESTYDDDVWERHFRDIRAAWNWAQTDRWLTEMCSANRSQQLAKALENSQIEERTILKELAAGKAWGHCMTALGEHERQALIAWKQAVGKIRRGTGRHAERYREEARQKLAECRGAIPAWVMPLYQVVQTMSPKKGLFDLVIVDEASQSGPEALLLNYIGDRIIIVGDDKQITPTHPGVNRDEVTRLRKIHLKEIPHSEAFDLESSLFSQAELRFPGRIRLREHFRCMPEIIEFSNQLSYSNQPLIPLRQFGADRLKPCKTTHVVDGYRSTGQSRNIVNEPEARALVDQVVKCLEDPAYEGKSFGVIALMGNAQAALIAKLLMQEVGAEEIENRRLLCGSARDFQGDERHVIFLSMVDAPQDGKMCRMIRDAETQRRFNVAVSRAKDQVWLFHSPTLNDLRSDCLRYKLLEHCLNPRVKQARVGDHDIDDLRRKATSADRDRTNSPNPFGSWFEVDVFLKIAERGYRVLPQYEVANRRIDLVVQGMVGSLAVECYGDEWHEGPDQVKKDNERQRQLERCGWTFCVIWGSHFYRDPVIALEPLWEKLEERNIHPEHKWPEERDKKEDLTPNASDHAAGDAEDEPRIENPSSPAPTMTGERQPREIAEDAEQQQHGAISSRAIRNAILAALEKCPNNTCTAKSITARCLKELRIITRGNPRLEFDKRVKRNIAILTQEDRIEEYRSKNKRLRLLKPASTIDG